MNTRLLAAVIVVAGTGAAFAEDRAPAATGAAHDWTGFYVGAHLGGARGRTHWNYLPLPGYEGNPDPGGFLGGAQAGFDVQFGALVLGLEGQFSWSGISGSAEVTNVPGYVAHTDIKSLATLTGRVGFSPWDRGLIYVKAGRTWLKQDHFVFYDYATQPVKEKRSAFTIGGGYEHAFAGNWSAKIEYSYADFGTREINIVEFNDPFDVKQNALHVIKGGVNYRFGFGNPGKAPVAVKN